MLEVGSIVDRYVVEAQIGIGGMAVVYRVRHLTLGTRHALKVLQSNHPEVRERMIQEGQVQAKLRHPHVVAATDVLDVDGQPGLLMEYIQGPALDQWLLTYRPTHDEALTLFRGIVAGVGYAHSKGLVHRDLKSANIMLRVDEDGVTPLVTDFGLAKVTRTDARMTRAGTTFGTPAFMAPEQIRDASAVDRRADLYSLGCILYELFCDRTPHIGDDLIELFRDVASGEYPDPRQFCPTIPDAAADCIEWLVQVRASRRLQDCAAVLEVLSGVDAPTAKRAAVLGPPRPMPDPGTTRLEVRSPGAAHARRFVTRLDSAPIQTDGWEQTPITGEPQPGLIGPTVLVLLGLVAAAVFSLSIGIAAAGIGFQFIQAPEPPAPTPIIVMQPPPAPPAPPPPKPLPLAPVSAPTPRPVQPLTVAPPTVVSTTPTVPITLKSKPAWGAVVWLDGARIGETPLRDQPISIGDHRIRLVRGDQHLERTIRVRKNGTKAWSWNIDASTWEAQ